MKMGFLIFVVLKHFEIQSSHREITIPVECENAWTPNICSAGLSCQKEGNNLQVGWFVPTHPQLLWRVRKLEENLDHAESLNRDPTKSRYYQGTNSPNPNGLNVDARLLYNYLVQGAPT